MGLFSTFVKTAIEVTKLPVAVVKDVVTLGNYGQGTYTEEKLEDIKEASEDK